MSTQIFEKIGIEFQDQFDVVSGQMFGKPCLKTAMNKAFVAYHNEQMVFKLGVEEIAKVKAGYPLGKNWDPSGKNRAMKDWLALPSTYVEDWESLAKVALDFVENASAK